MNPRLWIWLAACLFSPALGWSQCEEQRLAPPGAAAGGRFGVSVALDENLALIGAPYASGSVSQSGVAFVLRRVADRWLPEAGLEASDASPQQVFGISVDLDGEFAIIGARNDDATGNDSGSCYIFHRDSTGWTQEAKLVASDGMAGAEFGRSVAIQGNVAVVGAWRSQGQLSSSGAAYVFRKVAGSWIQEAKLVASDGAVGDEFGVVVDIDGDTIVVGADCDDRASLVDAGAAYVYVHNGSSWTEQAKLVAADAAPEDHFGFGLSLDGDRVAIGAFGDDELGPDSGSVYVFERNNSVWSSPHKCLPLDGADGDWFGFSLALEGTQLVVGAQLARVGAEQVGAAYLFQAQGSSWVQQARLQPRDSAAGDWFGVSISIHDDRALIGSWFADGGAMDEGAAYTFVLGDGCFLRGDCGQDGGQNLADVVYLLGNLFPTDNNGDGIPDPNPLRCLDACDNNDDGLLNLADVIAQLTFLFAPTSVPLPAPSDGCGPDPTSDGFADCTAAGSVCP